MSADREAALRERREATCECCRRNDAPLGERICRSCVRYQEPLLAELAAAREERDTLSELQPFPVETVMAWKRRVEDVEAVLRYVRLLLDPERQDESDEENSLRAFEALETLPLSVDVAARAALSEGEG